MICGKIKSGIALIYEKLGVIFITQNTNRVNFVPNSKSGPMSLALALIVTLPLVLGSPTS